MPICLHQGKNVAFGATTYVMRTESPRTTFTDPVMSPHTVNAPFLPYSTRDTIPPEIITAPSRGTVYVKGDPVSVISDADGRDIAGIGDRSVPFTQFSRITESC